MKIGQFYEYEGYTGTIEYDFKFDMWYGRVLGAETEVGYAGKTMLELYEQFKEKVKNIGDVNK
jgi:predicted HicB family RNase H-like nuclease